MVATVPVSFLATTLLYMTLPTRPIKALMRVTLPNMSNPIPIVSQWWTCCGCKRTGSLVKINRFRWGYTCPVVHCPAIQLQFRHCVAIPWPSLYPKNIIPFPRHIVLPWLGISLAGLKMGWSGGTHLDQWFWLNASCVGFSPPCWSGDFYPLGPFAHH